MMKMIVKNTKKIGGTINISGSKNVALPILCGSILSSKKVELQNIPNILDVSILIEILKSIGCKIKHYKDKTTIKSKRVNSIILNPKVEKIRGSYYLMGVMLARYNKCIIRFPGGCSFTNRPIDIHLMAFKELGYDVKICDNIIKITRKKEANSIVRFPKKSVGATINTLFACSRLQKEIKLINPSLEPEVLEVIEFLKELGILIKIADNTIIINGNINSKKVKFKIISDRIEAGSYLLLALSKMNSTITLNDVPVKYMDSVFKVLKEMGGMIEIKNNCVTLNAPSTLNKTNIEINEYPSFPTDLQQILTCVLLNANGTSTIKDNVYKERLTHVKELQKLKCNVLNRDNLIIINKSNIRRGLVIAKDLRCAFGLLVAGINSESQIIIENAEVLYRGYEDIETKLQKIGINVEKI